MTIRFAIWAAVSTLEQAAPDKVSLDVQVARCRAAALAKGWQETAGPYVAAGYSRSFYVDLSVAKEEIPPLRELLTAAHSNSYDVLVIYTYDRLGDIVEMVAQTLHFDRKQLYSISQAVDPQPPDTFDPYSSEAEGIMRDVARITQRFRINDLRRKWRAGVPARVEKGLTPLRIPYGYIYTGKKTPPRLDPVAASIILRIRDEFMSGKSLRSICFQLSTEGIRSPNSRPNWDSSSARYILANPYYAGSVSIGKTTRVHDARRKNRSRPVRQPASQWVSATGKHEALWDESTHQVILAELERRHAIKKRSATRFPLSGLLYCPVCQKKIYRRSSGSGKSRRKVLACASLPFHVYVRYDVALELVLETLARALSSRISEPQPPSSESAFDRDNKILLELKTRRGRIQDGFESGLYTKTEAAEKLFALSQQAEMLEARIRKDDQISTFWDEWRENVAVHPDLLEHFSEWIQSDDPNLVNRLLSSVIEKIYIHPDRSVEIQWRETVGSAEFSEIISKLPTSFV